MNYGSHINTDLPKNYGRDYPLYHAFNIYVTEIKDNFKNKVSGTLLVLIKRKKQRNAAINRTFKIKEPKFAQRLNLQQSVKYGAVIYLMAAMLAIPAGICSSQYATLEFLATPAFVQLLSVYTLLDKLAAADAAEYHRIEREKAAEAWLQAQPFFHGHVMRASNAYGIDAALIRAIILVESSNNPRAVSYRGAKGLMQLMPRTAKWLGVKDSFDPAHNIDGGVRYMRRLLDRFGGDVKLALAAYNAGSRHVRNYGGVPPFKATQNYIKKVLEYRRHFEEELAAAPMDTITS